jgi:hypothetical protein
MCYRVHSSEGYFDFFQIPNQKKRRIFHPALVLDRSPSLLSTASSAWSRRLASTPPPTPNSFPLFPQIEQAAGSPPRFLGSRFNPSPNLTAGVATTVSPLFFNAVPRPFLRIRVPDCAFPPSRSIESTSLPFSLQDRRGTLRLSRVSACYSRQPAAAIVSGPG